MKRKIGLTTRNRIECEEYLYPSDIFEIEGFEEYSDFEVLRDYTKEKFKLWKQQGIHQIELIVNGGLLVETLEAIRTANEYGILLTLYHRNRENGQYVMQEVTWQPVVFHDLAVENEAMLCVGRHKSPCRDIIFSEKIEDSNILDMGWLENRAKMFLREHKNKRLKVYATGLTSAMVAVLNCAARYGIAVVAMHYDVDAEAYFEQDLNE